MGWFEDGVFCVSGPPGDMIKEFLACRAEVIAEEAADGGATRDKDDDVGEGKTNPIQLGAPFHLRLDWWRTKEAEDAKLKSWSAGQKVADLFNGKISEKKNKKGESGYAPGMRDHFRMSVAKNPDDWLRAAEPVESPKPFSYDSRLSRNNALDLGHVDSSAMAFSPAAEVLAVVGAATFSTAGYREVGAQLVLHVGQPADS